jgi:gliding motility-associated-like protein
VAISDPDSVRVSTVPGDVTCFAGDDGRVEISATGGARPYKYFLNGIFQTDSIYTGLTVGNYIVVVEDNNGCVGSALFSISAPVGFSVDAGPDQQIVRGDVATLSGTASSPNGIQTYSWSPIQDLSCVLCQQTEATPQQDQRFVLEVIDSQGCVQFDTVTVLVKQDYQAFIPTVFSPNGDGLNDNFDFELLGADGGAMTIFDRWGEKVYFNSFQANGAGNGWDGFINGKPAPKDTYVYQLEVTYFDGNTEVISGTVSIVY